ncbi:MAG: hypothetical protein AAFR35_16840, partial [Pseudomonadota bacterium]
VIYALLCRFAVDLDALRERFGDLAGPVIRQAKLLERDAPAGSLVPLPDGRAGFEIAPAWRERTRLIASVFDVYLQSSAKRHSLAV